MSWRLRIEHTTTVKYADPVLTSFNEARMTPLTSPAQTVLESRVVVGPGAVPVWTYGDYWGSRVSVFDLPEPHDDLSIRAVASVETTAPPVPAGRSLTWDQVREATANSRLLEFSLPTPLTTLPEDIAGPVIDGLGGVSPAEAAERVCGQVREHVGYLPGATGVRTDAREAWDKGQGVCQDMAHAAVSLLRAAGLPARYVSGYLHPDPGAEPGTTAVGQSHAWIEYWAGEWAPLDPTSGADVAERHVVVARGRDYSDVPPLKGIYHGPADSVMDVTVEVTRLA
ncbi:MAG TPA: transglutaminase family protein [Trebonia sp.]|jgi:transglutaminase-like putative cysteine protease